MKAILRNRKINMYHFMLGLPFVIVGCILLVVYPYNDVSNLLLSCGLSWSGMVLLFGGDEDA